MTGCQCLIAGCSKEFTDLRGVDAHFAFVDEPPHPRSKLPVMKEKIREARAAKNSHTKYPSDWETIRRRILRRDNYRCQNPGCDARSGARGTAELHIHHQTPLSAGGSHNPTNLTTLCQDCHSDHHGWSIGSHSDDHPWWHGSGDDLLVRCGRCEQPAILQRNSGMNRIICAECGDYTITEPEPDPDYR